MRRKTLKDFDENGQKGDWCFHCKDTHIFIQFGDNPFTDAVSIPVTIDCGNPKAWKWNGDKNKPTLTPSILVHPIEGWSKGWHGYLTDGVLVSC